MTEQQAKKLAMQIVGEILDRGLADSTFKDLHPEAYEELLKYRLDLIADTEKILRKLMSDNITCDICKKPGRRRRGRHCPKDWFYGEFVEEGDVSEPTVIIACSKKCKEKFWVPGPGDLQTSPWYIRRTKINRDVTEILEEEDGETENH